LWEAGYWITPGGKFGGDFLAYPGDPALYHAQFIIRCVEPDEDLDPLALTGYLRLANTTKKTLAIAYFDENKITFQSFGWLGE